MDAYAAQWIGKRNSQEDAYAIKHFPTGTLAVICDGMGGHCHGAEASKMAASSFVDAFELAPAQSIVESLRSSLNHANSMIAKLFEGYTLDADDFGGSTLLAVFMTRFSLSWVSVGDSPLMLWRAGRLYRLNEDHSMRGILSECSQKGSTDHRNALRAGHVLRSALTGENIDLIDLPTRPYPLLPRDRVILATDGAEDLLYSYCLPSSVVQLLNTREGALAPQIIEACRQLDDQFADNVTVLSLDT